MAASRPYQFDKHPDRNNIKLFDATAFQAKHKRIADLLAGRQPQPAQNAEPPAPSSPSSRRT